MMGLPMLAARWFAFLYCIDRRAVCHGIYAFDAGDNNHRDVFHLALLPKRDDMLSRLARKAMIAFDLLPCRRRRLSSGRGSSND